MLTETERRERTRRYCCYLEDGKEEGKPCLNEPIWEVWEIGDDPYMCWDACFDHVAHMLTDAQLHEIHRIDGTIEIGTNKETS